MTSFPCSVRPEKFHPYGNMPAGRKTLLEIFKLLDWSRITLKTNDFEPEVVNSFKTVGECILESTVKDDKVTNLSNRGISQFLEIISAINEYLLRIKKIFYCISKNSQGPYHLGWSRLVSKCKNQGLPAGHFNMKAQSRKLEWKWGQMEGNISHPDNIWEKVG